MFEELLEMKLALQYEKCIFVTDYDNILNVYSCDSLIKKYEFKLIYYKDVEEFRYLFETKIKMSNDKYLVIVEEDIYIPYDVRKYFYYVDLSLGELFPKLNTYVLKNTMNLDLDLLHIAYENLFKNIISEDKTERFLKEEIYSESNVIEYVSFMKEKIENMLGNDITYNTWFAVNYYKAKINNICYKSRVLIDIGELNENIAKEFTTFIINKYKFLSGNSYFNGPILLNKCMDYILMKSKKWAVIVMDGMSVSDWLIILEKFENIKYDMSYSYALIPTITAISRQSLFSGKLPAELENPFNLSKEKKQFYEKCFQNGYKENEIKYHRGYDVEIDRVDKCIGIVINDIDDLVHSQMQGKDGMYRDILYLAKSNKLQKLINNLSNNGFDIYITSDHGNTNSTGIGKIKGTGVEVETKCKRALICKDFIDDEKIKDEHNLIEYPGYYLPKQYKYFICEENQSFGNKGEEIMSHGGISIEEVIVPFIAIKGVQE